MQALQQKQQQAERLRALLAGGEGEDKIRDRTIEERVDHCSDLQYVQHQQLFAVSYTSLHKAAAENSLVGVKFFLNKSSANYTPIHQLDKHGLTALHCAAEKGSNDVIRYLIDQGCDVDVPSAYQNTPLMHACKENQVESVLVFLELGGHITKQNKAGMNCIHFAAQSNHALMIEKIADFYKFGRVGSLLTVSEKKSNENYSAVHAEFHLVDYDHIPAHHPFFPILTSFNQPSHTKLTPLHMACLSNSSAAVETLLQYGVHVNKQDNMGETALHKAGRNSLHYVYKLLIGYGALESVENVFHQSANDLLLDKAEF